jgi:hypothetical protein
MTEKDFAEREAEKAREMASGTEAAIGAHQARVIQLRPNSVPLCYCGQPGTLQPDDLILCGACQAKREAPPREPSKWVPVAETARQIRAALKASFPHVKFSVRSKSYSMGSSVDVHWTDGPLTVQVEKITTGEILSGGNRFVHCTRDVGARVNAYAERRARELDDFDKLHAYDRPIHVWRVACRVEVRPDGQLLEWHL